MGYPFKILGTAASPDLLWAAAGERDSPREIASRLEIGAVKRMKLANWELPASSSDAMDVTLAVGPRCFVFRGDEPPHVIESRNCAAIAKLRQAGVSGGTILVRESMAWQVLADRNLLRTFRSDDGAELATIHFEAAPGTSGAIMAAVEFGDRWLAEWRSGPKRWLVLHSAAGQAISSGMALPVDADLFDGSAYAGLSFLKWENGKPAELIRVPALVEWSIGP